MTKREFLIKFAFAVIGDMILAFGATMMIQANFGVDTYTVANLGVSQALHVTLGFYQMCLGIVIGSIIFMISRKHLGVGSIVNILFTGYFIDFFSGLLQHFSLENSVLRFLYMLLGFVIYVLGISLYSQSGLGAGPYDAIPSVVIEKHQVKFFIVRMILDSTFLLIGFIFAGPIGIATFIAAFFIGPLLGIFNPKITHPLLTNMLKEK